MNSIRVKDIMIPLAEYATVSEDATLSEAVVSLEESQKNVEQDRYKHRAVLVLNEGKKVVGKLGQLDIIRALEPKYSRIGNLSETSRFGFSPDFIRSMMDNYQLWRKPLDHICQRASKMKVRDIMYTPKEGEYVSESDTIDQAIHQLVMGHHQSLLVTDEKGNITGILKLTDVFAEISNKIRTCSV